MTFPGPAFATARLESDGDFGPATDAALRRAHAPVGFRRGLAARTTPAMTHRRSQTRPTHAESAVGPNRASQRKWPLPRGADVDRLARSGLAARRRPARCSL